MALAEFAGVKFMFTFSFSPAAPTTAGAIEPLATKGAAIFAAQLCGSCHGDEGGGADIAPKLIDVEQKYSPERLASLLHHRMPKMIEDGMSPVDLNPTDIAALVAHLGSLKQLSGRNGGQR